MLSSVSYVCLGMCAGMWIISGGIYIGRTGFVFHLGLAVPAFGSFLFVLDFLLRECVFFLLLFCRCFQLYNAVGSSGCGSLGIWCFTIPSKFSSGCCVG